MSREHSSYVGIVEPPDEPLISRRAGCHIEENDITLSNQILGTGRFGDVTLGYWLSSPVACKRILPAEELTDVVRSRLESEVTALVAALAHPNLLPLYGITRGPQGSIYLVSRLAMGGSLKARVAALRVSNALLPIPEFMNVATSVTSGLAFLHSGGLVYRDLKSGGVLFGAMGVDGMSVVLDAEFGVVRFLLDQIAALHTRTSPGTGMALDAAYMAPEVLRLDASARVPQPPADIYSLGMVLYEMSVGHPPFRALREIEVRRARRVW
jgi:serine/threonine protein kinase